MQKALHGSIDPVIVPQLVVPDQHFIRSSDATARGDAHCVAVDSFTASADVTLQSVIATFLPAAKLVTVFGDNSGNTIDFSRNAAGDILVNGGTVPILGGTPTVANTSLIQAFGLAGNDVITLNETNGVLPHANLFGGGGNDTLTGGSGADLIFGQADNDTLLGRGGADLLFGGAGNDVLNGGTGNDQMFGEAGNDRMIWNPGDGSDLMDGGSGIDTAEVNGGNGAETFTVAANGLHVRFDRVDPAPFSLDIGTTENLVLNANGGDDVISAGNGLSPLIQLTIDGGDGNDRINGGDGNDTLLGGDGNDFIDGGRGNDVASLGAGDDVLQWDPGDGSDVVEGQAGRDTMLFNGSNVGERIDIAANGERLRFFRDVGNVTMDTKGVEHIEFNALGGADRITVNDLSGTDVTEVAINLAASSGGGDAQADTVIANATSANDAAIVVGDSSGVQVIGLAAHVTITGAQGATDILTVSGLAGDDVIDASGLQAGALQLVLDGGDGDDILIGSDGNDILMGGAGDDVLIGGGGNDIIDGGPGGNIIIQDFTAGAGDGDRIDLSGRGFSFDWLMAHASDVGGDAVLDLGNQHITLEGLSISALYQDDFLI